MLFFFPQVPILEYGSFCCIVKFMSVLIPNGSPQT